MLPSDRSDKKSTKRVSMFLGVDPGTLTIQRIKQKGEKDKAAADKLAPIVNEGIKKQAQTISDYARNGRALYNSAAKSGRDFLILKSLIPQQDGTPAGFSYGESYKEKGKPVTKKNNGYTFSSDKLMTRGGQFLGSGTATDNAQRYANSYQNSEYDRALKEAGTPIGAAARLRANDDNYGRVRNHLYKLDDETHNQYITDGSMMRDDLALLQDYDAFESGDSSLYNQEFLDDLSSRIERDNEYYSEWTRPEIYFDTETGEWVETRVYKKDAPLPPWVQPTIQNYEKWSYYLNYTDVTFSAQKEASAKAHAEQVKAASLGYKSAASDPDGIGVENSLIDAVIADFRDGDINKDHIGQYFRDYIVNPIRAQKYRTLAGNVLFGLGDTLDTFARGERAIVAAKQSLGGRYDEGQSAFENQNLYWINIPGYRTDQLHEAQRLFIQSGGLGLFNDNERLNSRLQNEGIYKSREELEAYLTEQFAKSGLDITWEEVRDALDEGYYSKSASEQLSDFFNQARRNLNKTYKLAGYDFNANTGDLVSDIAIETLTDPGLLFGGIAKSIVKGGVRDASKNAIITGFKAVLGDVNDASAILNNRKVQAAMRHLSKVDDGRNIIFRRAESLASDVDILTRTLVDEGVIDSLSSKRFRDAVLADLVERGKSMNSGIVANSPKFMSKVDNKLLKTAYYVDHGIDKIDTILLKASFAPPFVMSDIFKIAKKGLSMTQVGAYLSRKSITNGKVVQALLKGEGKGVRVMTEHLMHATNSSKFTKRDLMRGIRKIRTEFDDTAEAIERTVRRVREGKIAIEDATAEVDEYIRLLTNGDYKTIAEAEQWIETLDPLYRGEYQKGLEALKAARAKFDESVDLFNSKANQSFLDELRVAQTNNSGYTDVFDKYAGLVDFEYLRSDIENIIGESGTRSLINQTNDAIKNGVRLTATDVRVAIANASTSKLNSVKHRAIDAKDLRNTVPSKLKSAMGSKQDRWLFDDLDNVLSRKGDVNYLDIYEAIDHTMYKLSFAYSKKSLTKYSDVYNELKAFQDALRQTDTIATNSVETLSNYHLDLHTTLNSLLNDAKIRDMLDDYYDNMYSDVIKELDSLDFNDLSKEEQSVALAIQQLRRRRESIRMYEDFENDISSITGMTNQKAYAICSAVLGRYNGGKDVLTEITRNPNGVHDYINELLYNNYGGSKLNMKVLRNQVGSLLTSKPDEFFAGSRFIKELEDPDKAHVREWLYNKVSASLDDPQVYTDMQMLTVLTMNPAEIKRLNHQLDIGEQPYLIHVSTTGLNVDANSITGIGYRKWRRVEDPDNVSLEDIYKIFQAEEPVEFRVRMTDEQITNNISHADLKAIYSSEDSDSVLRERFAKMFGGGDSIENPESEGDILERFFKMLYDDQVAGQGKRKVIKPYNFVVHDLQSSSGADAFNMRMLNGRAQKYISDSTKPYMSQYANPNGLSRRTAAKTSNTLSGFRELIDDNGLTESEFYEVERKIKEYAAKRAQAPVSSFSIMDLDGYVDDSIAIHHYVKNFKVTDDTSDWIKTLMKNDSKFGFDGAGVMESINSVKSANELAKHYVVASGMAHNKMIGSLSSAAPGFTQHMSQEAHTALNNIASLFGVDLTLSAPSGDAALGHRWAHSGNTALRTDEIMLNPYYQANIAETLMHELRHSWSLNDRFGRPFKTKIKNNLLADLASQSKKGMSGQQIVNLLSSTTLINKKPKDPLVWYTRYIGVRYSNLTPLTDLWMDEFVAPIFQHYFTNQQALDNLKQHMLKMGFDRMAEGQQALSFIDDFSVIVRSSENMKQWGGVLEAVDNVSMHNALNDCLMRLTSDDDLLEECANSILHAIGNKDTLQADILEAVSKSNAVTAARAGINGPNVLNVATRYSLDQARKYYSLGDTYASELDLINSGTLSGNVTPEGLKYAQNTINHIEIQHSLPMLEKMSDDAKYITKVRNHDLTSNAAELIRPYGNDAKEFLSFVRDFANSNMNLTGASSYEHLRYILDSDNAVDNYLMCQKIYDDVCSLLYVKKNLERQTPFLEAFRDAYEQAIGVNFSDDFMRVLNGDLDLQIYKSGRIKDQYARRFHYTVNDLENEIERARNYRNATYEIASNINQREHASLRLMLNGIKTAEDSMVGRAWQGVLSALDKCSSRVNSKIFQDTTQRLSLRYHEVLQQYRLARLRNADGVFDKDLLLSELLWNGHNHIVFQTARYSDDEMKELIGFVENLKKTGMDFISCDVDATTNKLYIYLNNNIEVYADTLSPVEKRYVVFKDGKYSRSYTRPQFQNLHTAELLDTNGKGGIQEMIDAWQSIDLLSGGLSRGTSGRVLTENEIKHYYNTLPAFMKDMASPKNMLDSQASARLIYDPGFIIEGDTDYFLDMLDTMRYQKQVMNNGTATLAYMFGNGAPSHFGYIMNGVSDEEILSFFNKESDFVVATLVPNKNCIHGVEMKQLRMDNPGAIEFARNSDNAVILPYDTYLTVLGDINRSTNPTSIRASLNQALLVMKAFQLCNVGSWVRNWYDATKKAAMDMGETPSNTWTLLMYQGKAMRDFFTFRKILKSYDGYVDGHSWDIIKNTFDTDMSYEDFEILSNMFQSSSTTLDSKYFKRNAWQKLSGEEGGVRGLSEKDIKEAFTDTYGARITPLEKDIFLGIHQGKIQPTEVQQQYYDDMVREIDTHLRSTRLNITPQKATNILFHPFSLSENIVRYAQTQYLRDFGMTDGQISKRIHLTQFNSRRSTSAGYLEYAIPYVNYTYDNCMYWMRMMEENPRYFKYFSDAYGNIVSSHIEDMLDQGQQFDMERDNMVKTGGVPLGHDGLYFKLNPSFLDFVNNMYGGWPNVVDRLNPLLNIAVRDTLSDFGFGSQYFFSELDLNLSEDDVAYNVASITPIVNQIYSYHNAYKRTNDYFGDSAGMPVKTMFTVFAPLFGIPIKYEKNAGGSFEEWQETLAAQGKWFDCNTNTIVDLEQKNEEGANNPENTWEDRQAYMLVHFGKVWDGNLDKWVNYWERTEGGFNDTFDFDNDPTAWDRLCKLYYERKGMVFDYNTGHFVLENQLSDGDLNDEDADWQKRCKIAEEKFNVVWDANQNSFVPANGSEYNDWNIRQAQRYANFGEVWDANIGHYAEEGSIILGGLNDPNLNGAQKAALRLALFGKQWNDKTKQYDVIQEPSIVTLDKLVPDDSENMYALLGIPRLTRINSDAKLHIDADGLLVTDDGKYVMTRNSAYNEKLFNKITAPYTRQYRTRRYPGWKRYSYHKGFSRTTKIRTAKIRPFHNPYISQTGYGFNSDKGYFRYEFEYRYQMRYHNVKPKSRLQRTITPHIHYIYGGGYNKFSYYTR